MSFLIFERMWQRVEATRSDSDASVFNDLLYFGELIAKVTVAGLVASIRDDPDRLRYRQAHRLVRVDGIGDWAATAEELLTGPPSQHTIHEARDTQTALNQRNVPGTWQYEAIAQMHETMRLVGAPRDEKLPERLHGKRWLHDFAELRNKTRGHGAVPPHKAALAAPKLEESLRLFSSNLPLFSLPWAFLRRNLSGKYRVSPITTGAPFSQLRPDATLSLQDGVYVFLDSPRFVELLSSDPDLTDFFVPNGAFKGQKYELLSYLTGTTILADTSPYLATAAELPASETQGLGALDVLGRCFANVPNPPSAYVVRSRLEGELESALHDDRHPVVTLHGPGGIGKTSLALTVIHRLAHTERFSLIVWFSSRDIELTPAGPKPVRPHVLSEADIAAEYAALVKPAEASERKTFRAPEYFASSLTSNPNGATLFVFDNFETVQSPTDLYQWLDARVRLPNKILITTRFRDFKGDYPVEVAGMFEDESRRLIDAVARSLGVSDLLTDDYRQGLHRESSGHPYVMKILLGEVVRARQCVKIERIVAANDQILTALFERTYAWLAPAAKRVFLTLCNWRSTVPLLGLKAVVLRPANERIDIDAAVESLERSAFIELIKSDHDGELFVAVPLAAAVFGRRKLQVDPMKAAVEADCDFLRQFGAIQESEVRRGLEPRVQWLFGQAARATTVDRTRLADYLPVLQLVANSFPPAWLLLADLYEELDRHGYANEVKGAVLKFLETAPSEAKQRFEAWQRLAGLARATEDAVTEVHSLVELCQNTEVPFDVLSDSANRVNGRFREGNAQLKGEEKFILVRKLISAMAARTKEAQATDLSRLAWLCLHVGDTDSAARYTRQGLRLEDDNVHCRKLAERLQLIVDATA